MHIASSATLVGIAIAISAGLAAQCATGVTQLDAPGAVFGLTTTPDGTLVGCGSFASGGSTHGWVARLQNGAWQSMGTFDGAVYAIRSRNAGFVIGGRFDYVGGTFVGRIARGGDNGWSPIVDAQTNQVGVNGEVWCLGSSSQGLVIGGTFISIAGHTAHRVARLQGDVFEQIGPTFGLGNSVRVLDGSNGLIAGGDFPGGIARFSATWKVVGGGTNGPVHALTHYDGELVVGGSFSTAGGAPAANIARGMAGRGMRSDRV